MACQRTVVVAIGVVIGSRHRVAICVMACQRTVVVAIGVVMVAGIEFYACDGVPGGQWLWVLVSVCEVIIGLWCLLWRVGIGLLSMDYNIKPCNVGTYGSQGTYCMAEFANGFAPTGNELPNTTFIQYV
eukprot:551774-Amorphochlora_amoeboformis.AAC.1